jgi:hypothetical protein
LILLLRYEGDMLINARFAQHMVISFLERITTQLKETYSHEKIVFFYFIIFGILNNLTLKMQEIVFQGL